VAEFSTKPDAEYKRLRYRTDDAYRLDQNRRNREWRAKKKQDPAWRRYEAVRVMINTKREAIQRTEELLRKQERRLVDLCREFVRLKSRLPKDRRFRG
jgi:hypothetical protein